MSRKSKEEPNFIQKSIENIRNEAFSAATFKAQNFKRGIMLMLLG